MDNLAGTLIYSPLKDLSHVKQKQPIAKRKLEQLQSAVKVKIAKACDIDVHSLDSPQKPAPSPPTVSKDSEHISYLMEQLKIKVSAAPRRERRYLLTSQWFPFTGHSKGSCTNFM